MPHPPSHGHHGPSHIQTPKKSLPGDLPPSNLQGKVVILAKINIGITLIPLIGLSCFLFMFYARDDIFLDYSKNNNQTFVGSNIQLFTSQEKQKQWTNLLLQFGWCMGETILAYVLLRGSKTRDYGFMKAWLILMTAAFFAEIAVQLMILGNGATQANDLPIIVLAIFVVGDVYRIVCIIIVYMLVDEMVERGEVKASPDRDSNYELSM